MSRGEWGGSTGAGLCIQFLILKSGNVRYLIAVWCIWYYFGQGKYDVTNEIVHQKSKSHLCRLAPQFARDFDKFLSWKPSKNE